MKDHIIAGHPVRVYTRSVDDTGDQQLRSVAGLPGEEFTKVPTMQAFGLASNPPPGADGIMLSIMGHRDNAMVLGGEHPDYRPKLSSGDTQVYNIGGCYLWLQGENAILLAPTQITLQVGSTSIVLSEDGVVINGNVQINGKTTGSGDAVFNGISSDNHTHLYTPGSGAPTQSAKPT